MTLEELQAAQTNFVLQRAQAKDMVEQCERQLGQVNMAIQALEARAKLLAEQALAESADREPAH